MNDIAASNDPALRSWVTSANLPETDFPIQNLPYGRFRRSDQPWRIGIAIGDQVLDLRLAAEQGAWTAAVRQLLAPLAAGDLNAFMALGPTARRSLRQALSQALSEGGTHAALAPCLVPQAEVELGVPCRIGDYTDFYVGIHRATVSIR